MRLVPGVIADSKVLTVDPYPGAKQLPCSVFWGKLERLMFRAKRPLATFPGCSFPRGS